MTLALHTTYAPRRPRPRASTVVSYMVFAAIVALGAWSIAELNYSVKNFRTTTSNLNRFVSMATPMEWPGWDVVGTRQPGGSTTFETVWVGFGPIWHIVDSILVTLALVVVGTALAALLSIPVAYGAARNTSPHPVVMAICRGIGVVARAVPDVALVVFLAFLWFNTGMLAAIVGVGLHSVGMISKMFADAIEQVDEGPRLAVRSAGGTKGQQFWAGIVPQALPAWIAVTLHRADINLRSTVILGVVGVQGVGYELDDALHAGPAGMRRVIALVTIIILLCVVFEVISSLIRARLLGVQPTGKGDGVTAVRGATVASSTSAAVNERAETNTDRNARIESTLRRPWNRSRVVTSMWIWSGVAIVIASLLYTKPDLPRLFSGWRIDQVSNKDLDRAVWPPNFGSRDWSDVFAGVRTTLQVAFAATLLGAVLSVFIGPLSARNVAPTNVVRNFFRTITLLIRAIPDLVLAILFIIATGFGPQAAALALGIGGVGLLAKLIGDSMEEVPPGPERALRASGGSRTQVFFSSTVPLSIPALVSHLMYLLEQNIRSATVLGIVGGGGIGFLLLNALQGRHFDQVIAFLMVIVAMVVIVELASILIRRAVK